VALTGETGSGKSIAARLFIETVQTSVRWCSLAGKEGDDATAHLERQIIRWLADLRGHELWISYFSGRISVDQAIYALTAEDPHSTLVIDDLVGHHSGPRLTNLVNFIVGAFSRAGGKLLTTGHTVADSQISIMGPRISVVSVGQLSEVDIGAMLESAGAPTSVRRRETMALITAVTSAHPTLVTITIDWLRRRNWAFGVEEIQAVFSGEPIRGVKAEAWLKAGEILDEESKELLFRLSLISLPFRYSMVQSVAGVDPAIAHAAEAHARLQGPFIVAAGEDLESVTALLKGTGREILSAGVLRRTHEAIAEEILSGGVVNIDNAAEIITHLLGAQNYQRYALFLIRLMLEIKSAAQARSMLWLGAIPDHSEVMGAQSEFGLRLGVAAGQYRIRVLAGQDSSSKQAEMLALMSRVRPDNQSDELMLLHSLVSTGILLDGSDPAMTLRNTMRAVSLIKAGGVVAPDAFGMPIDDAIWLAAFRLRTLDHMRLFLGELRDMPDDQRTALFASDVAFETLQTAVDSCWNTELEKEPGARDWNAVLGALDEVAEAGAMPGGELLRYAAKRARAIVLGEQLKQVDEAIMTLDHGDLSERSDVRFLIHYTRAVILADQVDAVAAKDDLRATLNEETNAFTYYRLDAERRLGVAYARLRELGDATASYKRGVRSTSELAVLAFDRIDILGELAWVFKAAEAYARSAGCLYAAAKTLHDLAAQQASDRYRESYIKLMYALPWFWWSANHPEDSFPGWRGTIGFVPGIFARRGYNVEPSWAPPFGYTSASLFLLSGLVGALSVPRLALKSARLAESVTESAEIRAMLLPHLSSLEASNGDPGRAIAFGMEAAEVLARFGAAPANSATRDSSLWWLVIGPASVAVLASTQPPDTLSRLRSAIQENVSDSGQLNYWGGALNQVEQVIAAAAQRQEPPLLSPQMQGQYVPELLYRIAHGMSTQRDLREALTDHASVCAWIYQQSARAMLRAASDVMLEHWERISEQQAFRLRNPQVFRSELDRIQSLPILRRPAALTFAVADALGARVPEDFSRELRHWLTVPL
jgi:hypothetical protein